MAEQLQLVPAPQKAVTLTERQAFALALLANAGADGLGADEIGAAWCQQRGIHSAESRCKFCGQSGQGLANELKAKGLARYRRARGDTPGAWLHADAPSAPERSARGMLPDDQPIPF